MVQIDNSIKKIIKIQAFWKGYYSRRNHKIRKYSLNNKFNYFSSEEAKETGSEDNYNPNANREEKPKYKFKSGATYTGML